ncbi:TlpA disulfide reductase family protein [Aliivibrio sp. S2TY2]|uniref:TlpA family protein disulfide reductase n=1 Tax=unclassified Aliivibrio TaxID=2645654 RepID=UPI0023796134|nr:MULTISPECIES: TlpA disulfide reductase family protein [unclassified Aliivibrio]MDD9176146.1 TlpA disulfide reductase family protein [Aliivibrio sp. S3TY1]MDD9193246.1 TlpA disulfide reductase family protein [Aliivibrio sp. S2TY2]
MSRRLLNIFVIIHLFGFSMPTKAQQCPLVESFQPAIVDKSQLPMVMQHSLDQSPISLVNLWAVWCSPCRKELPMLVTLEQSKMHNITVNTVHIGKQTPEVAQVIADVGLQQLNKGFLSDMSSMSVMGIYGLPATMVAVKGEVKFIASGYLHHTAAVYKQWLVCLEESL